jgi:hypothetical protein
MLNWFKKKPPPLDIRDTLFGDLPFQEWPREKAEMIDEEPWPSFVTIRDSVTIHDTVEAMRMLQRIVSTPGLESRHYLQAWHFLRLLGAEPGRAEAKHVHGVVVEVGMEQGPDLLAAYDDYHARYFNYSGRAIIWEHPDTSLDDEIDALLEAGQVLARQLGPWERERPPAPGNGSVRVNILTPSGLHFGQGPFEDLARDPIGGPTLTCATRLMQEMIAKTENRT